MLWNDQAREDQRWRFARLGDVQGLEGIDFEIFAELGEARLCDVQIFEALDPGRRPGAEKEQSGELQPILRQEDVWGPLRTSLRKKLDHRFRWPTVLLCYANAFGSIYENDPWSPVAACESVAATANPRVARVREIWILDSSGESARRAWPSRAELPRP